METAVDLLESGNADIISFGRLESSAHTTQETTPVTPAQYSFVLIVTLILIMS